jgi:NDP-sugar pyrophosphorylase family protein
MSYKVLLTASGIGSRLGEFTKFTNKSLVTVGNKPAIARIVEQYPQDIEFVVTLGYFGSHVKQFLEIAYPSRKFTFVEVVNYDDNGSSLAWSQLCAREYLQCPFIYNACDTIVSGIIPPVITHNWVGAKLGSGSSQYDSITVGSDGNISSFHKKGYMNSTHFHIGLIGVKDYNDYWKFMEKLYIEDPNNRTLNDVATIESMLLKGFEWRVVEFKKWFDIGNVVALKSAREKWKDELNVLEKNEESISLVNGKVIKFFYNSEITRKRVKRCDLLRDLTPDILLSSENFYSYKYVPGDTASNSINPAKIKDLIRWADQNLWIEHPPVNNFKSHCRYFYDTKTRSRVDLFLQKYSSKGSHVINDVAVPSIEVLLEKIPWDILCDTKPCQFHGDFILDNIVIQSNGNFKLLDWRHEFGDGLISAGDVYYDLAKINHNLTVNHDIVCKNLFTIHIDKNNVFCDILRKDNLVKCNKVFLEETKKLGYDTNKIEMLTGIVWLNMAPLHHRPFDEFLFYYGKLKLFLALEEHYKKQKLSL